MSSKEELKSQVGDFVLHGVLSLTGAPVEPAGVMPGCSLMDAFRFGSAVCPTAGVQRQTSDRQPSEPSEARRAAAVSWRANNQMLLLTRPRLLRGGGA